MPLDPKLLVRTLMAAVAFHAAAIALRLPETIIVGPELNPDRNTSPGEVTLALLFLLACVPLLMWKRETRQETSTAPLSSRQLTGWVLLHLVLVAAAGSALTGWAPMLDDEAVYQFQAQLLLEGRVREPFTVFDSQVRMNPYFIFIPRAEGGADWAGCYPFLAGLVTAPGLAMGMPNLLWFPLGSLIVWQGTRLAERIAPKAPAHLVPLLLATSPALIGLALMKHTALLAALWSLLAARCVLTPSKHGDLAAGALVGLAVHSRPLDGLLLAVVVGLAILIQARGSTPHPPLPRLLRCGLGGLPFLIGLLAYNQAVTGDVTVLPYQLIFDGTPLFGFGSSVFGEHTPASALRNGALSFAKFATWGLPLPLLLAALLLAFRAAQRGSRVSAHLLLIVGSHYLAYAGVPFGQHAIAGVSYGIWVLIPFAMLIAVVVGEHEHWAPKAFALGALLSLTVLPYAGVVARGYAQHNAAPREAAHALAAEHGPIVVMHHSFETHPSRSLMYHPPIVTDPDAPVQWWYDAARMNMRRQGLAAFPDRPAFYIAWSPEPEPRLIVERLR
jgi:hypothetical protein